MCIHMFKIMIYHQSFINYAEVNVTHCDSLWGAQSPICIAYCHLFLIFVIDFIDFVFFETGSRCVIQAGLIDFMIFPSQPHECWDYGNVPPYLDLLTFKI